MAAYLRFYQFDSSPFEIGNQKRAIVLGTKSLRGAFAQVKQGLDQDSPRICLSGSTGVGKTSFCRALPRLLSDDAQVATILNPRRSWQEIRATIAKKFNLEGGVISRRALIQARESSKQLVLVIDEAESLNHESLDHLDILLQYKCDDGKQLLHCVMLADLDAAATGVEIPLLWWLDKLTTLQLQFSPIPVAGLRHYVEKHLAKAGWAGGELFTHDAIEAIHHYTGGVPRAINELCEKILMEGGARGINSISANFIEQLCDVPATDSANPDSGSASDFSSDFSIGDFGTGPSAQELLDAEVPEETNQPEVRIAPDADFMAKQPEDLQSLILTQDSAEELRVEPEPDLKGQPSLTIELEDDPIERMREQEAFLVRSASRSRVDMKRIPSGYHAPKRHGGRLTFALIIAGIGYAVYSQFALPTQIIDEAEVKIIKALKRQPPTQPTEQAEEQPEAIEEIEEEPILPRSLLDRADELAAETGLDKIPLPSLDEMVADPTEELSQAEKVGNSDLQGVESGEITPSEFATPVSEDIVVLNEYTAIPEAASTAPKPSIPGTEKIKPDSPRSRAATTEKTAKRVFPQQGGHPKPKASETDTKPPMPAKIDAEPSANSTKPLPAVQLPAAIDTNPKEIEEEAVVPTPEPETTEADLLSTTPIWL